VYHLRPAPVLLDRIAVFLHDLYIDALTLSRSLTPGPAQAGLDTLIGRVNAVIASINGQRPHADRDALLAMRHLSTALTHLVHAAEHLAAETPTGQEAMTSLRQVESAARCLRVGHSDLLRALARQAAPATTDERAVA
jgi:hypothetical protein